MCSLWLVSTVMALSQYHLHDSNSGLCVQVTETSYSYSTDDNANCNRLLQEFSERLLFIFSSYYIILYHISYHISYYIILYYIILYYIIYHIVSYRISYHIISYHIILYIKGKCKVIPLQARCGP